MSSRKKFEPSKHPSRYQTIDWQAFSTRFTPRLHKPFAKAFDQLNPIIVFSADADGNVHLEGDLIIACDTANIVIDGTLVIDGNVAMVVDEGFGNFMLVTGNVKAHAICLKGFPELVIGGNVECSHGIVGIYGDDGGFLDVAGNIKAPVVVADSYFNVNCLGTVDAVTVNTSHRPMKAQYTPENVREILLDEFFDEQANDADDSEDEDELDNTLNGEAIFNAVRMGRSILKPRDATRHEGDS